MEYVTQKNIYYIWHMASKTYIQHYSDGTSKRVARVAKQGRKPSGLGKKREVRLYAKQDVELEQVAKQYGYYWNANEFIRDAVREKLHNFAHVELLNT